MTDLLTPLKEVTQLLKERNPSNELIVSQAVEQARRRPSQGRSPRNRRPALKRKPPSSSYQRATARGEGAALLT